MDATVKKPWIY